MMWKIDNPLKIELDLDRLGRSSSDCFTTCDPVVFKVTLELEVAQEIGKLIVRFYGTSYSWRKIEDSVRSVQPWLFLYDLSPPEINNYLDAGTHTWYFKTAFPALTVSSYVETEDEKFDPSFLGYHDGAHPLPPSCNVHAKYTSALEVEGKVWYGIDAEYTRIGGKPGKLMKPVYLNLNYIPLEQGPYQNPKLRLLRSETFTVRSMGLLPGHLDDSDGEKELSWRDWRHNKFHKKDLPVYTFRLDLFAKDKYTIGHAPSVWLQVAHNPDGTSSLPTGVPPPEVYLESADLGLWSWLHARGNHAWKFATSALPRDQNSVDDPVCHKEIKFRAKKNGGLKVIPTNTTSKSEAWLDLSTANGEVTAWNRWENTCPDFATYNLIVKQALEVNCEIICGGIRFDFDYQKQGWGKFGTWPKPAIEQIKLVSGVHERQHNLVGRELVGDEAEGIGDMSWTLVDPDDRPEWKDYVFEPVVTWSRSE